MPDALTAEQHEWTSQFCAVDTTARAPDPASETDSPGSASGGDGSQAAEPATIGATANDDASDDRSMASGAQSGASQSSMIEIAPGEDPDRAATPEQSPPAPSSSGEPPSSEAPAQPVSNEPAAINSGTVASGESPNDPGVESGGAGAGSDGNAPSDQPQVGQETGGAAGGGSNESQPTSSDDGGGGSGQAGNSSTSGSNDPANPTGAQPTGGGSKPQPKPVWWSKAVASTPWKQWKDDEKEAAMYDYRAARRGQIGRIVDKGQRGDKAQEDADEEVIRLLDPYKEDIKTFDFNHATIRITSTPSGESLFKTKVTFTATVTLRTEVKAPAAGKVRFDAVTGGTFLTSLGTMPLASGSASLATDLLQLES